MRISPINTNHKQNYNTVFKSKGPQNVATNLKNSIADRPNRRALYGIPRRPKDGYSIYLNDQLRKYFQMINKFPLLSPEEEFEIAKQAKENNDTEAKQKLINSNLRFVVNIAKNYVNKGLHLYDLIQEGNIGLIKAAETFDYTMGFKFISYAVWDIDASIRAALREKSRMVRLPGNVLNILNKINLASIELTQSLERFPTTQELADKLQIPEEKIKDIFMLTKPAISYDSPLCPDDDSDNLIEFLSSEDNDTGANSDNVQQEKLYYIREQMKKLGDMEKEVIALSFGLKDGVERTTDEIALMYHTSSKEILKIKNKALKKLKEYCENINITE